MKIRNKRWVALFFALMFTAGNTLALARTCLIDLHGSQHEAAMRVIAQAAPQDCLPSADTASDPADCAKSAASDDQKSGWTDVPPVAAATTSALPHLTDRTVPVLALLDSPPRVGPSLTILFGRFLI